jgi:hypothetical protein
MEDRITIGGKTVLETLCEYVDRYMKDDDAETVFNLLWGIGSAVNLQRVFVDNKKNMEN